MVRRWYLVLLGLLFSLGAAAGAAVQVGPRYMLVSEVLLLPPNDVDVHIPNPYLNLDGLSAAVDVVALAAVDPVAMSSMRRQGLDADVVVERDITSPAPLAKVTVLARTPAKAMTAQEILLKQFPTTVSGLQSSAGIPAAGQITTSVVVESRTPTPVRKSQVRYSLAVLILGGGLTLLLVGGLDAALTLVDSAA